MSQRRLKMRKILEILRLHFDHGLSGRAIALAVQCALSTVQECLKRFLAAGLSWPVALDPEALEARLYPRVERSEEPDYAAALERLRSFKGITRERVWQEQRDGGLTALSYSAFCAGLARYMGLLKLSCRQVHAPGAVMFVDYAGPPLYVTDRSNGMKRAVRVFVASLGFSAAVFAWATPGETRADWLEGHSRAVAYFDGVPARVVPDNPKALVHAPCRYEPELNPSYVEWSEHYGCAVVPARVRRPQDKALVEQAVLLLERWAYPELLAQTFFDLPSLNAALMALVEQANRKPFQKRDGSRWDALREERLALAPLPDQTYRYGEWTRVKVPSDYHVEVQQRFYSVPYGLVGKTLEVRRGTELVEIYHAGKRVASHRVLASRSATATVPEHRPQSHQARTVEPLLQRASVIGDATLAVVQAKLIKKHPDEAHRAILGILRLGRDYGDVALEAACQLALKLGNVSYRTIERLLQLPSDVQTLNSVERNQANVSATPHEHVRGPSYFATLSTTTGVVPCNTH
jgi:transposase